MRCTVESLCRTAGFFFIVCAPLPGGRVRPATDKSLQNGSSSISKHAPFEKRAACAPCGEKASCQAVFQCLRIFF